MEATPRPALATRLTAAIGYLFLWLGGLLILLMVRRERVTERWHAVQAIVFGVVFSAFMVPATLASLDLIGPPPDWLGFILSILGLVFVIVWLGLILSTLMGWRLRIPGAAALADKMVRM